MDPASCTDILSMASRCEWDGRGGQGKITHKRHNSTCPVQNYGVDDAHLVYVQKEVDQGEDNENNDFLIHKREPYGFGIGKREPYGFGIGKREPYGFGIGKRGDNGDFVYVKREPYGFGIGKRSREDFGSFGRYWGKRQPYNFGVGK